MPTQRDKLVPPVSKQHSANSNPVPARRGARVQRSGRLKYRNKYCHAGCHNPTAAATCPTRFPRSPVGIDAKNRRAKHETPSETLEKVLLFTRLFYFSKNHLNFSKIHHFTSVKFLSKTKVTNRIGEFRLIDLGSVILLTAERSTRAQCVIEINRNYYDRV